MPTEKVTITLPVTVIRQIDALARKRGQTRSAVLASAAKEELAKIEADAMRVGYLELNRENKRFAEQGARIAEETLPAWEDKDWSGEGRSTGSTGIRRTAASKRAYARR